MFTAFSFLYCWVSCEYSSLVLTRRCHHTAQVNRPVSCWLHSVPVFSWPVCSAEAAVFRLRHLRGCPHRGNAQRFITYWCTLSTNTPQKTPTVHSWLMSCSASSPWIIFLRRIFPLFSPLLSCDFTSSVKKIKCSVCHQIKNPSFSPAIMCLSCWERKEMKWRWMVYCHSSFAALSSFLFCSRVGSWVALFVFLWQGSLTPVFFCRQV